MVLPSSVTLTIEQRRGVALIMKAPLTGLVAVLLVVLIFLQWQLWGGAGGVSELRQLEAQLATQQSENETLRLRNEMLENEVLDLKTGIEAIEERARSDLGMTREGETFYMVIE